MEGADFSRFREGLSDELAFKPKGEGRERAAKPHQEHSRQQVQMPCSAWRIAQPCAWSLVNYRHVHEKRSQSRAVGPDPTGAWGWWEEFLCHSNCKGKH